MSARISSGRWPRRAMFSARPHDEGVFVADIDHQGGDVGFAENAERVQTPLAADQKVLVGCSSSPGHAVTGMAFFKPIDLMFSTISSKIFIFGSQELRISTRAIGIRVTVSGILVSMAAASRCVDQGVGVKWRGSFLVGGRWLHT